MFNFSPPSRTPRPRWSTKPDLCCFDKSEAGEGNGRTGRWRSGVKTDSCDAFRVIYSEVRFFFSATPWVSDVDHTALATSPKRWIVTNCYGRTMTGSRRRKMITFNCPFSGLCYSGGPLSGCFLFFFHLMPRLDGTQPGTGIRWN